MNLTTARKLHMNDASLVDDNLKNVDQVIDKSIKLVDRLEESIVADINRAILLDAKIKKVKASIREEEKELKEIKANLLDYARTNDLKTMEGGEGKVCFSPRVSRNVNVKNLFLFLQREKKLPTFWKYVKGVLKALTADYGEQVLENEGVISSSADLFGSMKVVARK
jgi:hypothetical protein